MATTVGNFTAIDDSEVDAESPITESLVTRLRDNAYWVNEGTTQTSQGTGDKLLQTDGSGGVEWVDKDDVGGIEGTKGIGTLGSSSGAPTQIAIVTNRVLMISIMPSIGASSDYLLIGFIDSSDDTFTGQEVGQISNSGTLTGSFQTFGNSTRYYVRKNSTNYEFYEDTTGAFTYSYIWM